MVETFLWGSGTGKEAMMRVLAAFVTVISGVAWAIPAFAQPGLTPVELQAAYCIGTIDGEIDLFQRLPGGKTPILEQQRQSVTSQLFEKDKPLRDRYLRYLAATGTVFDTNNMGAFIGFSVATQRGKADVTECFQYTSKCLNTEGCHLTLDPAPCVRPTQCHFPEKLLPFPF